MMVVQQLQLVEFVGVQNQIQRLLIVKLLMGQGLEILQAFLPGLLKIRLIIRGLMPQIMQEQTTVTK